MCCSNCDVTAPSSVQWPLLWTRGASSLTTSRPSGMRKSSAVSVPVRPIARASRSPRAAARVATSAGTGAGATLSARIPSSCTFCASGYERSRPSTLRVDDDRDLRRERHLGLGQQWLAGRPTQPFEGVIELVARRQSKLAAAVVAAARRLESKRQTQVAGCRAQVVRRADLAPRRDLDAGRLHEPTFGQAVLGHGQRHASRSDGDDGIDRGHDVDARRAPART